jgi:sigma-B regulation protein RsbU (phosphoserine phosphatase)
MEQKKLYRTIETVASKKFDSEKDLLFDVVQQIVENENINVTGGRVWELRPEKKGYQLLFQTGNVSRIEGDFVLKINDYPILNEIAQERTVLADETNQTLKEKGIFRYSASGVGRKIKLNGQSYYPYLLAVNSPNIDEDLNYTLNIVATVLTSKLNERRLVASRKHLIADIDAAKNLQKSILPEHELEFVNYELFGVTIPAEIIGGDFFDYLNIGDGEERVGIAVGDAASKGLSAAAEAMYVAGAARMASTFNLKISPFMNRMNELVNKIFADDKFSSLFYGEISNDKKGLFLYANAGHNPPIFMDKKKKEITYLEPTGPLLGPAPHSKYETDSINFNNGDVLVIYSDGITEAANANYEFYETDRLEEVIKNNMEKSPKEIVHAILEDVDNFSTYNSKYQDDKTLVVIKRKDSK